MSAPAVVGRSALPLPLLARGKVRDVYDAGEDRLLIVASDRISAFDVVLREPIPWKGIILTQISAWWFARLGDITPHHLITADPVRIAEALPLLEPHPEALDGRAMLVRRTEVLPIEAVVRGYIAGSAWAEYSRHGTLAGEPLPEGLMESEALPHPIFSPATKAAEGHDENITFDQVRETIGDEPAREIRERALRIYQRGRDLTAPAGILLADTKFEFGRAADGTLLLIDEVLTPDSSRFWPMESYDVGRGQPSLDKQPVRDYLESLVVRGDWNREPPPPALSAEVVAATSQRYRRAFRRLTGYVIESFPMHAPGSEAPRATGPA
jgi:phosphoribosylaminoimidazole-succinocarboxamide synthase